LHQVRAYFNGRYTPQSKVIVQIARALRMSELRRLSEFPWALLSPAALTLVDIENICAPGRRKPIFVLKNKVRKDKLKRGHSRWHRPQFFDPIFLKIRSPGDPEGFWQSLASYRAAEVLQDFESMNAHRWAAVTRIASIATLPAVAAHSSLLFECMSELTRRTSNRYVWFAVDWNAVREILETLAFGPYSSLSPFCHLFQGTPSDICEST